MINKKKIFLIFFLIVISSFWLIYFFNRDFFELKTLFINLENISAFTNILININYSIDYETTKLLIDSKLIPNLVFIIKQN